MNLVMMEIQTMMMHVLLQEQQLRFHDEYKQFDVHLRVVMIVLLSSQMEMVILKNVMNEEMEMLIFV